MISSISDGKSNAENENGVIAPESSLFIFFLSCSRKTIMTTIIQEWCTSSGMSFSRKVSSRCENFGRSAGSLPSAAGENGSSSPSPANSENASVISSTRSTITPSMPITCCMYTASTTLLDRTREQCKCQNRGRERERDSSL